MTSSIDDLLAEFSDYKNEIRRLYKDEPYFRRLGEEYAVLGWELGRLAKAETVEPRCGRCPSLTTRRADLKAQIEAVLAACILDAPKAPARAALKH